MWLGEFREQRADGLEALENQIWPEGEPKLDLYHSITAYVNDEDKIIIIDGNHRWTLFKKHDMTEWSIMLISKEVQLLPQDIS